MNKQKLIDVIREHLEKDIATLKAAAQATYEAATHEESKAENEYDTRGLEASYLAGAQAKRAAEIEEVLFVVNHLSIREFAPDEPTGLTAIVEVEYEGRTHFVFILPKGGGLSVQYEGQTVQIVTPSSHLGRKEGLHFALDRHPFGE